MEKVKRLGVYLTEEHWDKIKNELARRGKNTGMKKSELLREIIDSYDSDEIYFSEQQLKVLQTGFANITRAGSNINQLIYHINVEHIKFINSGSNNYCLNPVKFVNELEAIKKEIISLKKEIKELVTIKRVG